MRRIFTHVAALPPESGFARSRRGVWADWSQQVELLAGVVDSIRVLNANLLAVNGNKPDEPQRVPRPADEPVEAMNPADLTTLLRGGLLD